MITELPIDLIRDWVAVTRYDASAPEDEDADAKRGYLLDRFNDNVNSYAEQNRGCGDNPEETVGELAKALRRQIREAAAQYYDDETFVTDEGSL